MRGTPPLADGKDTKVSLISQVKAAHGLEVIVTVVVGQDDTFPLVSCNAISLVLKRFVRLVMPAGGVSVAKSVGVPAIPTAHAFGLSEKVKVV
jgi:hypothetical protein